MSMGQVAFESTVGVFLLALFLQHAQLHCPVCLYLNIHSAELVAATSLTVTQNDTGLCSFKWHRDLSGKSQKWYRENEVCAMLPPTLPLPQSSQLFLCVLSWFGRVP